MTKRLGSVRFGRSRRGRYVVHELALNLALFSPINWNVLAESILHEMAHVAAILHDGETGHGPAWRRWARSVGCGRVCELLFVPHDAHTVAEVPPLPTIRRAPRPRREVAGNRVQAIGPAARVRIPSRERMSSMVGAGS